MAAILPTKVDLADEEVLRINGKQWDIVVVFKMMKHYEQVWPPRGIPLIQVAYFSPL